MAATVISDQWIFLELSGHGTVRTSHFAELSHRGRRRPVALRGSKTALTDCELSVPIHCGSNGSPT